jgi:hypothetical protein
MVDDYVGYKVMFIDGPTELLCVAHTRCKFFGVHAASRSLAPSKPCIASQNATRSNSKAPD